MDTKDHPFLGGLLLKTVPNFYLTSISTPTTMAAIAVISLENLNGKKWLIP
jgi:hypothetical protein